MRVYRDDPRVKTILDECDYLERKGEDFTFESFTAEIHTCLSLFRKLLKYQFTYRDYGAIYKKAKKIFNEVKAMKNEGEIPSYIPRLADIANEDDFAVSICTVDGQVINLGSTKEKVCMHAISNVVSYLIALAQYGEDEVKKYIGAEHSGNNFNSLELMENGLPHNPLNSAGGLMS